jgi:nucleotide-binding universal stress UspA family protein
MTGWAVTNRLVSQIRTKFSFSLIGLIAGTVLASLLTTAATIIIFSERFLEGAWTYLIFIPMLYAFFSYVRNRLGAPSPMMEYLGRLDAAQLAGFGFGQMSVSKEDSNGDIFEEVEISWQPEPIEKSIWRDVRIEINKIAVLLDGSLYAAQAIPYAEAICRGTGAHLVLLSSVKNETQAQQEVFDEVSQGRQTYLTGVTEQLRGRGLSVSAEVRAGYLADTTKQLVEEYDIDLVVTSTVGKSGNPHWLSGGISSKLMRQITKPVLLVQMVDEQAVIQPNMERILVTLDGSILSENTLPYARALAKAFSSEIVLLAVPQVPEVQSYRAPDQAVEQIRAQMEATMENFLDAVGRSLREDGIEVRTMTKGSLPVRTIVSVGEEEETDLIMLTSRGRGGLDRLFIGSVAERVVAESDQAVLMVPVIEELDEPLAEEPVEEPALEQPTP